MRLLNKYILGRITPQDTMHGSIHLPAQYLAKRGTGNVNFEPIEVVVEQVGPGVRGVLPGMVLVLDSQEYDKIDDDHIIFPETHYGNFYWKDTFIPLTSRELERMKMDSNTQAMRTKEGRMYYVDADPLKNKIVGGVIMFAKEPQLG